MVENRHAASPPSISGLMADSSLHFQITAGEVCHWRIPCSLLRL